MQWAGLEVNAIFLLKLQMIILLETARRFTPSTWIRINLKATNKGSMLKEIKVARSNRVSMPTAVIDYLVRSRRRRPVIGVNLTV